MSNMTLDQLIKTTEYSLGLDKKILNDMRDEAKRENRSLTDDEKNVVTMMEPKIEAGKANLERLRAAKAEDQAANAAMQTTRSTGVELPNGRQSSFRADGTSLYGVGASESNAGGPQWQARGTSPDGSIPAGMDNAALTREQSWADHPVTRAHSERMAEYDRISMGMHGGSFAQQIRSVSTSGASAIVPTIWSNQIIDKVRNKAVTLKAGVTVVPMPSKIYQVGRLNTDPTAAFKTEGATISASDPAWDFVQLQATTLTALTVVSREYLQDAINADSVVMDAISSVMALEIDKTVLYGGFLTADGVAGEGYNLASPYPTNGVFKNLLTNASGNILGNATNGTVQTATTWFRELQTLYFSIKKRNENPGAMVMNDGMLQRYVDAYDSQGRNLNLPDNLANAGILTTNAIPNVTRGTGTAMSNVFCADWSQVLLGQRQEIEVRVLTERYAENNQVGIVSTWRGDTNLARLSAAGIYRYLQGN